MAVISPCIQLCKRDSERGEVVSMNHGGTWRGKRAHKVTRARESPVATRQSQPDWEVLAGQLAIGSDMSLGRKWNRRRQR